MQQLSIRSFLAQGHPVELFTYDEVGSIPEGTVIRYAETVLPRNKVFALREDRQFQGSYAAFSDIFRYKLLSKEGGWWVDLDVICLRPLSFEEEWVFASQRSRKQGWITATCVIRTPPNSDLMAHCFDEATYHQLRETRWGIIGPALVHDAAHRYSLTKFVKPWETFCPIDWWKAETILQPGSPPQNSHAIHLWNEVWRHSGWNTEPTYSPDTLYQKLHALYPPQTQANFMKATLD
jgi:Glycosyltransferase sugar-binding region containing DXD motif